MNEYIIVNKTAIEKRIAELINQNPMGINTPSVKELKQILSQSTPLIPEIEKAFDSGRTVKNYKGEWKETYSDIMTSAKYEESKDYISNLKLDI